MADTRVKVGLSEELLALIDEARGDVPRERWLRRLAEEHFAPSTTGLPTPSKTEVAGPRQAGRPNTPAGQHDFKTQYGTFRCAVCGVMQSRHS